MAAGNINNAQPIRIEGGGKLVISNGTTDFTIHNIDTGSIAFEPGGYEVLEYTNYGEMQVPLEGNEQPSKITIKCKMVKQDATNNLDALSNARNTSGGSGGLVKTYSIWSDTPDYKGATTGVRHSFANCYFLKPVKITRGVQFDMLEMELGSSEPSFTIVTY